MDYLSRTWNKLNDSLCQRLILIGLLAHIIFSKLVKNIVLWRLQYRVLAQRISGPIYDSINAWILSDMWYTDARNQIKAPGPATNKAATVDTVVTAMTEIFTDDVSKCFISNSAGAFSMPTTSTSTECLERHHQQVWSQVHDVINWRKVTLLRRVWSRDSTYS